MVEQIRRNLVLCALAATIAGCGTGSPADNRAVTDASSSAVVEVGDISSVVALDATVVARPAFVITAHAPGTIHLSPPPEAVLDRVVVVATIGVGPSSSQVELPAYSGFATWLVRDGDPVTAGLPILAAYYSGLAVEASIPEDSLYRFYGPLGEMQAQIHRGPGPFSCPMLGDLAASPDGSTQPIGTPRPTATAATPTSDGTANPVGTSEAAAMGPALISSTSGTVALVCSPPRDLLLFPGMDAVLAVTTGEAHDVLTLPVEAVAGSSQRGLVTRVGSDGKTQRVEVQLGITDGIRIEIKSGLAAGDKVAVPGPFLQGAQP